MHTKKLLHLCLGVAALLALTAAPGLAKFQMIYTPESALEKGGSLPLTTIFTHPFEAGHTMDMGNPQEFFVVHKGEKTDLLETLEPIMWTGLENTGKGYETSYRLKSMGDYVFALAPAVYYEESEGAYMQQFTKMIVNLAGLPTDWDSLVGLPAEILPLAKPYGLWTGNVFAGVVCSDGDPVPFAEIEVEYLNHLPNQEKKAFEIPAALEAPQDCFVTQTIRADAEGTFVYAMPKAGWWGFAALGVGPKKEHKGKELSQDAVIWVQVRDM